MLNDFLWPDHIQWQPPTDQTLYRTRPITEFWVISMEHLRRVWHADRRRLLLRTPGPVPLGLAYVLLVETNPFPSLSLFYRTMLFEYPSVLSRFCFCTYKQCDLLKNFIYFMYFSDLQEQNGVVKRLNWSTSGRPQCPPNVHVYDCAHELMSLWIRMLRKKSA